MTTDFPSLVEMLRHRAATAGDTIAYTFLVDGEHEGDAITYGQLDRRARAIAATLQGRGLEAGSRALLLYPPGLDFIAAFFGCLYAGVVAVPSYPPHPAQVSRALPRLLAITCDAEVSVVLCSEPVAVMAPAVAALAPALATLAWLATDEIDERRAMAWQAPPLDANALAFLQYTSGSTAAPKGVMVSHGNLLHNEELIKNAPRHEYKDRKNDKAGNAKDVCVKEAKAALSAAKADAQAQMKTANAN